MIDISRLLSILGERGVSPTSLKTNGIVVGASHDKLIKAAKGQYPSDGITLKTISALCRALNCQPGDIMEYVPDDTQE